MATKTAFSSTSLLRRFCVAILKIFVSLGLLYFLFGTYDIELALTKASDIGLSTCLVSAFLILAGMALAAWRWVIVVGALGGKLSWRSSFSLVWIATFFNQALPSNLSGDAVRIWMFYRQDGVLRRAIGGVLLDRITALVGLAILVLLAFPIGVNLIDDRTTLAILALLVLAVFTGLFIFLWLDRVTVLFLPLFSSRIHQSVLSLAKDTRILLGPRQKGFQVFGLSIGNHILIVFVMSVLAHGLSIELEITALLVLIPPVILASLLPISFAGWGVREGTMIAMLGTINVSPENAFVLSVAFGLLSLILSLPGALIWLVSENKKPSEN